MTAWLQIICLAIIQGITEFIPISSSGHLVLARHALSVEAPGLILELVLHAGSLFSIVVFFRRRLIDLAVSLVTGSAEARQYAFLIVLGSLPAGVIGLLFKDILSQRFEAPVATATMLMLTGLILLSSGLSPRRDARPLTWRKGLLVGIAQALAILPGISRSGTTITVGRRLGLTPAVAAEFSFILSIPVLCGTSLLMLRDLGSAQDAGWSPAMLIVGMLISAVVGYLALEILLRILRSGRFWVFGVYCLFAGSVALWVLRP